MISEKFDCANASEVSAPSGILASLQAELPAEDGLNPPPEALAKMGAALIVAALPLVGLWLLLRWVWQDLKAIARGIRFFYRAVADDLSR